MDIANDVVDVFVVDDNLAVAALYETLLELVNAAGVFNGVNLRSGHHTVADLRLREIECVLEYLYLLFNIVVTPGVVNA